MKVRNAIISIDNLRLYARHGVIEQEQIVGGEYSLSLRMHCDISRAMLTDDVNDTVDYGKVSQIAVEEMKQSSLLLENAIYRLASRLLKEFRQIDSIDVRLTKLTPPTGLLSDGATLEASFSRD